MVESVGAITLLIEPYGIEIRFINTNNCLITTLLIEPYGIEIGNIVIFDANGGLAFNRTLWN